MPAGEIVNAVIKDKPFFDTSGGGVTLSGGEPTIDDKDHQKFCGVSNELILSNFTRLYQKYLEGGIEILPRTPFIPGVTDTEKNITAITDLYQAHGVTRAALLRYNPLWHEKNMKLGIGSLSGKKGKAAQWMSREKENSCRNIYKKAGIEIV